MYDLSPLTRPLSPQESSDLDRRLKAGEFGPVSGNGPLVAILIVVAALVIGMTALSGVLSAVTAFGAAGAGDSLSGGFLVVPALMLVGFLVVTVAIIYFGIKGFRSRHDWKQVAAFALANGLHFRRNSANPTYPGLLFGLGHDRHSHDHVWAAEGDLADVGRYSYSTGSGDDETTHTWTYAAFRLPRMMPHLVLDNRSNDGFGSNLPTRFKRSQQLSLGGVFDQQWRLYSPQGYGQDTFQIFTPDVMEALVTSRYTFDMEIVDNWLFLYSRGGSLRDPALWHQIEHIRSAVVARVSDRRYIDRRPEGAMLAPVSALVPGPGQPIAPIAPQGRRLQTGWSAGAMVGIVLALLWWIFGDLILPRLMGL